MWDSDRWTSEGVEDERPRGEKDDLVEKEINLAEVEEYDTKEEEAVADPEQEVCPNGLTDTELSSLESLDSEDEVEVKETKKLSKRRKKKTKVEENVAEETNQHTDNQLNEAEGKTVEEEPPKVVDNVDENPKEINVEELEKKVQFPRLLMTKQMKRKKRVKCLILRAECPKSPALQFNG